MTVPAKTKTFIIKVDGGAVSLITDEKKFDALDQFVLTLLFGHYRKEKPERLKRLVNLINTNLEAYQGPEATRLRNIITELDHQRKLASGN